MQAHKIQKNAENRTKSKTKKYTKTTNNLKKRMSILNPINHYRN